MAAAINTRSEFVKTQWRSFRRVKHIIISSINVIIIVIVVVVVVIITFTIDVIVYPFCLIIRSSLLSLLLFPHTLSSSLSSLSTALLSLFTHLLFDAIIINVTILTHSICGCHLSLPSIFHQICLQVFLHLSTGPLQLIQIIQSISGSSHVLWQLSL